MSKRSVEKKFISKSLEVILILLFVFPVKAMEGNQPIDGESDFDGGKRPYIINGTSVDISEYPFMANLHFMFKTQAIFKCGGTIVGARWILTTASCITDLKPSKPKLPSVLPWLKVQVGSNRWNIASGTVLEIEKYIPHPYYKSYKDYGWDLGLVKTKTKIPLNSKNVRKVTLAETGTPPVDVAAKVTIVGWGAIVGGTAQRAFPPSPTLRKLQIKLMPWKVCKEICEKDFGGDECGLDQDNEFCSKEKSAGAYYGDMGGPVLNEQGVQVGIVARLVRDSRLFEEKSPRVYEWTVPHNQWLSTATGGEVFPDLFKNSANSRDSFVPVNSPMSYSNESIKFHKI